MKRYIKFSFLLLLIFNSASAQIVAPKALIVIAHPDDESGFAATVYKITHEMNGQVDLLLVTNGEGGYKYSTLAESIYGVELTDEKVGRENLPRIRKQELMNAGKILGIRNYFFLDQTDAHYGLDEREPLDSSWDVELVNHRLNQVLMKTKYDFVFCLLPLPGTHGGHKAASMLALRAIKDLPQTQRPVILGCTISSKTDTSKTEFAQLKDYTETKIKKDVPQFQFDRTVGFGFKKALNYKIIVNWEIAEHKSQGTMQLGMNQGDFENFWYFDINGNAGVDKCKQFFEALKVIPYPSKMY